MSRCRNWRVFDMGLSASVSKKVSSGIGVIKKDQAFCSSFKFDERLSVNSGSEINFLIRAPTGDQV